MALLLDDLPPNSDAPDVLALRSLADETPEETAELLKEHGNIALGKGPAWYPEAISYYTQAIEQRSSSAQANSTYRANRAHVHILRKNFGRALRDAQEAARLNTANIKAYARAAKAGLLLGTASSLATALQCAQEGIARDPSNDYIKNVQRQVLNKLAEATKTAEHAAARRAEAEVSRWRMTQGASREADFVVHAGDLAAALNQRGIRLGQSNFEQHTLGKKPWVDTAGNLHWPVVLVYGAVMATDILEDVNEQDTLAAHLEISREAVLRRKRMSAHRKEVVFFLSKDAQSALCCSLDPIMSSQGHLDSSPHVFGEESPPLPWDEGKEYRLSTIELYYQSNAVPAFSEEATVLSLMEDQGGGQTISREIHEKHEAVDWSERGKRQWVKVDLKATLRATLGKDDHVVAGIPAFYVVAKGTEFRERLLHGGWVPP
eukprot:SM000300S11718  [mRNA]  locus=s300:687:2997:- [translate_table: standard]